MDKAIRSGLEAQRPTGWDAPRGDADLRHISQKALARRWNVSTRTLERWRVWGTGPAYLKLNGRVSYRLVDVEAFEAERLHASTNRRVAGTAR